MFIDMDTDESQEFCEACHIGVLRTHRAAYAQWHDGHLVIVPQVMSWRCDFCGDIFYDDEALLRLALLLGLESNPEDQRRWRAPGFDESRREAVSDRRLV